MWCSRQKAAVVCASETTPEHWSDCRQPLALPHAVSFSPDGKWLAFHRNEPQTSFDILSQL
jgi:hypothetical protein